MYRLEKKMHIIRILKMFSMFLNMLVCIISPLLPVPSTKSTLFGLQTNPKVPSPSGPFPTKAYLSHRKPPATEKEEVAAGRPAVVSNGLY